MNTQVSRSGSRRVFRRLIAIICAISVTTVSGVACARQTVGPAVGSAAAPAVDPAVQEGARISADQLDSLVAPIALYPDPLLSQTLVASTYPLEIVQLQQWLSKNSGLTGKALTDAVSKQPWDPSIQAMAALPDAVKRLSDDLQWTTDLGNAFLAQQSDVMDAVQRMRQKAQGKGSLQSNQQQTVETQTVEGKTVVIVQQADPQVVYVPSYDPMYVYGEPAYPYPSIYYPSYSGVVAASAISFGVGMAIGAAWGGGGWGWNTGWGGGNNNININNNNNFVRNSNVSGNRGGGNTWQHNPTHRGGAPYGDRGTANKFGGAARGDSLANRQAGARQQVGRQGGNLGSADKSRGGGAGVSDRSRAGGTDRPGAGASDRSRTGGADRAGAGASDRARSGVAGDRSSRDSAGARSGGGADRAGSRDVGRSSGGGGKSAFGGGSGGFSGSNAKSSSSRGSSSMGSRGGGGGGGSRGGGGGGSRGGGGGGGRGGGGGGGRRR